MRRFLALTAIVLGLVLQAGNVRASVFKVTPVRVTFSGPSSTLLTLKNESDQALRFQITAFSWKQDPKGEVQLGPTDDIVFFPALLSLNPGEERKVRVATTIGATDTEKTYRIFFEELPPLEKPNETAGAQVRILTKMGIPIFVEPPRERTEATVEAVQFAKGTLTFDVRNAGNVHFGLEGVTLHGSGPNGETVFDRQLEGWYVLAGSPRSYNVQIPAAECSKLKKLVIEARTDDPSVGKSGTITKEFEVPPGACQ
ncbi:MAG TPA: fimbria/pilus periplasmic chaperone [Thermoanaerobaculia bacterium]|nr:fimbria/pilus periplasmic chaperone [Thermoanaerobaculia bacterium]